MNLEIGTLWGAIASYAVAGTAAVGGVARRRLAERALLALLVLGVACHTISIAARWTRVGHGPFVTMYEILSSNVWSLTALFTLACWRLRVVRPSAALVLPWDPLESTCRHASLSIL